MNLALSAALHNASEGAAVGSPFLPASFFNATSWSAGAGANGSVAAAPDVGDVPQVPAYIRTASTVACVIIMSIGVAGNAMVPAVILRSRDMRNSTNIFLVNLSVADLLVLLVCTPTVLVEVHSRPEVWLLGETMCEYDRKALLHSYSYTALRLQATKVG
ncbi:G-protein coupled receptor 83-like [Schistocerca nitens]|uniref:G-protein coupled receptor 83-like n=1 Tax=Schistocerca nitens TaxID=7011 RepID=UPI0021188EC8|nr:G-protein coupled receptor 83-like [Schistocerca nitens]